ncbi:MAG: DegV family protein [Aggregatilineales bacterium]
MQIVTDRAADITPQQIGDAELHFIPLIVTLAGREYRSGVDLQPDEFFRLLEETGAMPATSLPAPGEIAAFYRQIAARDPDIISIHVSSALSGTYNAARLAAEMVPEANITVYDARTVSGGLGWQVEAAVRAARAGWSRQQILDLVAQVHRASNIVFTIPSIKYLVHGGRISNLKGLIATTLNIKPLLGVDIESGRIVQQGTVRTFKRALEYLGHVIAARHPPGTPMRMQAMHANNPEGLAEAMAHLDRMFDCEWLPANDVGPVIGAHSGPGLVGVGYAARAEFPALP